jgi:hypothetical protein
MPRVDSFACAKPSNHFARNQAAMARTDCKILIERVYTAIQANSRLAVVFQQQRILSLYSTTAGD